MCWLFSVIGWAGCVLSKVYFGLFVKGQWLWGFYLGLLSILLICTSFCYVCNINLKSGVMNLSTKLFLFIITWTSVLLIVPHVFQHFFPLCLWKMSLAYWLRLLWVCNVLLMGWLFSHIDSSKQMSMAGGALSPSKTFLNFFNVYLKIFSVMWFHFHG